MPDEPGTGPDPSGQGGGAPPATPTDPPAADPSSAPAKTFTQDEVSTIATREAAEAARRATRQLVSSLNFQNQDELIQWVSRAREAEKAQMTEAELKLAEAAEKEAVALARVAEAEATIRRVNVKEALIDADCPLGDAELVSPMVQVEPGASKEDIATAVADLKAKLPHLFGARSTPSGVSSEPASGGAPATRSGTVDRLSMGAQRAREMQGRTSS